MTAVLAAPVLAPPTVPPCPARPRLRPLHHEPDPDDPLDDPLDDARPVVVPAVPVVPPPVDEPPGAEALRRHTGHVLRLALEVVDGRRPAGQLAPLLHPRALRYVRVTARRTPGSPPARLTRVHLCRPHRDAVEVAAVYRTGERAAVAAARFERGRPGRTAHEWQCVELRLL